MLWCAQSTLHHCFRPCLLEYSLMCSNCFKQVHWNCVKFLCSYGQKISRLIRHTLLEWSFSPVGPAHMACGARPVAVARFYGSVDRIRCWFYKPSLGFPSIYIVPLVFSINQSSFASPILLSIISAYRFWLMVLAFLQATTTNTHVVAWFVIFHFSTRMMSHVHTVANDYTYQ